MSQRSWFWFRVSHRAVRGLPLLPADGERVALVSAQASSEDDFALYADLADAIARDGGADPFEDA
jgi:hypothetical protein